MAGQPLLSAEQIELLFADPYWRDRFPPFLTTEQAAELVQVPVGTIRAWRVRGLLDRCCFNPTGRHLRYLRNAFVDLVVNYGLLHRDTTPQDR